MKKNRAAFKDFLIRFSIACVLFLAIYLIVEFQPEFIPINLAALKDLLAEEKLPLPWMK